MGELLRRRVMMQSAGGGSEPNAITASTASWFVTPITRPKSNYIEIIGRIVPLSQMTSSYQILDHTASKTFLGRMSSSNTLRYNYYGNDWYASLATGGKEIRRILISMPTSNFSATYADDTSGTCADTKTWPALTGNFRVHLGPFVAISELKQYTASATVHDLVPQIVDGVVGMLDLVDDTFYPDTSGYAYLTTI